MKFLRYFTLLMLFYSCDKGDNQIEEASLGSIEVTVLLGDVPAIGASVTTVPETDTKIVSGTGIVTINNIPFGKYRVNVTLPELDDFVYYQELNVLTRGTSKIIFEIPEIPVLTEQDLDVALLLNQSYQGLQRIFDADAYLTYWGDTGTDILKANRMVDGTLVELDAYFFSPQLNIINQVWIEHYEQIGQVNKGIDYLVNPNSVVANTIDRELTIAHLRFLRGLLYFNLVKVYGNPVLVTTSEIDLNNPPNYPQDPVTTYTQIEEDLLFAVQNLPVTGVNDRANQESARALLAKVYMKMAGFPLNETSNYGKALELLNSIYGQYVLMPSFKTVFDEENEASNTEVIFKVSFDGQENTSSSFNNYWGPLGVSERDALVLANGFANSFTDTPAGFQNPVTFPIELDDSRFYTSVATFSVSGNTIINNSNPDDWRPLKWYNGEVQDVRFDSGSFDYPYLRYAEVLLLLAEAENALNGPTALAYTAINQIRRRAYGDSNHDISNGLGQEQFFEQIVLERKRELCFEGHRRDDLIRWGKLQQVIDEYNAINEFQKDFEPHEYIWPIPQQELNLNPNANQNPGY